MDDDTVADRSEIIEEVLKGLRFEPEIYERALQSTRSALESGRIPTTHDFSDLTTDESAHSPPEIRTAMLALCAFLTEGDSASLDFDSSVMRLRESPNFSKDVDVERLRDAIAKLGPPAVAYGILRQSVGITFNTLSGAYTRVSRVYAFHEEYSVDSLENPRKYQPSESVSLPLIALQLDYLHAGMRSSDSLTLGLTRNEAAELASQLRLAIRQLDSVDQGEERKP